MSRTVSLAGTRLGLGIALQHLFFGPLTLIVYAVAAFVLGTWGFANGFSSHMLVTIALFSFPIVVIHEFIEQNFIHADRSSWGTNVLEALSFRVARNVRQSHAVTLYDLVQSAAKSPSGSFVIQEMGLERASFLVAVQGILEQRENDIESFLEGAKVVQTTLERKRIDSGVILYHLLTNDDRFETLLHTADLSKEDIASIVHWERFHTLCTHRPPFWSPEGLLSSFGGVGRSWVMGYTDQLDALTIDISASILGDARRNVRIHNDARATAMQTLSQAAHHDVLIVGPKGVGKRTLVENITYALRREERSRFQSYTRVLQLKTEELLSGVDNPDTFLLSALKKAKSSGKFILVVEDLALLLSAGGEKLRSIIVKFLKEKNIQFIGIIATEDYHQYVRSSPDLDHYFEKLTLDDATDEETMAVMMERYFDLEHQKHVKITYKALRSILTLAKRYVGKGAFPGKAVDILEEAVVLARKAHSSFVRDEHIREVISRKANIDITQVTDGEREKLLNIDDALRKTIVGQEDAVRSLASTLKRARAEVGAHERPLGTFLFLGPTGVGKTHTAKTLAKEYFGSVDRMIRLDMNEYATENAMENIVGSAASTGGFLTQRVHDDPFSLILLDEIEKAHPSVLNLFLQILDEGQLIDQRGMKTDFRNTIIVATSNAGALFIRDTFRDDPASVDRKVFKEKLVDHVLREQLFSPEFLNRFDEVIVFEPLTHEEAEKVAVLMLNAVTAELRAKRGVLLQVERDAIDYIVETGYSAEFGAREMRRVILDTIENYVAEHLLKNDVKRGDVIEIKRDDIAN